MLTPNELRAEMSPAVARITTADSQGTGFVFDDRGFILTSARILGTSDTVTVTLPTLGVTEATVVGRDQFTDIAVLRVTFAGEVPFLAFADTSATPVGTEVGALGYAGGFISSPTALLTEGTVVSQQGVNGVVYIQTNASVDAGFSGGPLLTLKGDVIGMVTTQIEEILGRQVQGVGLAIHIQSIAARIDQLMRGAQLYRPTSPEELLPPDTAPPQPPFPNILSGTVFIDGKPAPDGVRVYARLGRYVSQSVAVRDGRYPFLTIQPPTEAGYAGQLITFYVDGFLAEETLIYNPTQDNPLRTLNLTVTVPPNP